MLTNLTIVLLILLLIAVAISIWKVKKLTQPKSQKAVESAQTKMQRRLQGMKKELKDWKNYSYKDISSAMLFKETQGTVDYLEGMIFAPDQQPIFVFEREETGIRTKGYLLAASSEFELFFDIHPTETTIKFNDEILGKIEKSGTIYNATGDVIGHAEHPPKISFDIAGYQYRAGENFYPLHLNERKLANIWVAPNYSDPDAPKKLAEIFEENKWGLPLLELHDEPTPNEEKWLTALAVLEVAFHGHWLV